MTSPPPPPVESPREPENDLAHAASAFRMATFRLARRLRAERAVDSMSDGQFAVLAVLKNFGPHTLGDLAARERVTPPSMNRTVNGLEEAGMLTRTGHTDDRRKVTVTLTEAGRTVVEETSRRRDAWLEQGLEEISSADREVLASAAEIMRRLADR